MKDRPPVTINSQSLRGETSTSDYLKSEEVLRAVKKRDIKHSELMSAVQKKSVVLDLNNSIEDRSIVLRELEEQVGSGAIQQVLAEQAGFKSLPPTIKEFYEDSDFLGKFTKNGTQLYDRWKEHLGNIFPTPLGGKYSVIILTGSIGIGKSYIERYHLAYTTCKMLHYKDPHEYFNLGASEILQAVAYAPIKELASSLLFDPLMSMLVDSKYFKTKMDEARAYKSVTLFPNRINIIPSASVRSFVGKQVFAASMDEISEMGVSKTENERAMKNMFSRITSRFGTPENVFPTGGMVIGSSAKDDQSTLNGFLDDLIKTESGMDQVYMVSEPIWKFKPQNFDMTSMFPVFTGNELEDPRILTNEEMQQMQADPEFSEKIVMCPSNTKSAFELDMTVALQDLAGVVTKSSQAFIGSSEVISNSMLQVEDHPLTKQVLVTSVDRIHEPSRPIISYFKDSYFKRFSDSGYSGYIVPDNVDLDAAAEAAEALGLPLEEVIGGTIRKETNESNVVSPSTIIEELNESNFNYDSPRFIHMDLSDTGDSTGIACTYHAGYRIITRMDWVKNRSYTVKEPIFYTEWALTIQPSKDFPIPIWAVRELIIDLRRRGVPIRMVSSDKVHWSVIKELDHLGFDTKYISVDRSTDPYFSLRSMMQEGRWKMPESKVAIKELRGLVMVKSGKRSKVDHTTTGSKDTTDAISGSVYSALNYSDLEMTDIIGSLDHQETVNKIAGSSSSTIRIAGQDIDLTDIPRED